MQQIYTCYSHFILISNWLGDHDENNCLLLELNSRVPRLQHIYIKMAFIYWQNSKHIYSFANLKTKRLKCSLEIVLYNYTIIHIAFVCPRLHIESTRGLYTQHIYIFAPLTPPNAIAIVFLFTPKN